MNIDPWRVHITQNRDARFNPRGPEDSANCGPTSLAMALACQGIDLPGDPQDRIEASRRAMFPSPDSRATDFSALTDVWDVERGAHLAGADTTRVSDLRSLRAAIREGATAVLAGDPQAPGAHGPRCDVRWRGGHFLVVAGHHGSRYTVLDPLCQGGPTTLTERELKAFTSVHIYTDCIGVAVKAR